MRITIRLEWLALAAYLLIACAVPPRTMGADGRPAEPISPAATPMATASPSGAGPSSAPLPPGWNPQTTATGLQLTVEPDHGVVGAGVRIAGHVDRRLLVGDAVTVLFWPNGPTRPLADRSARDDQQAWPSSWTLPVDSSGRFGDVVKVPRVIQDPDGELRTVEPGRHDFVLIVDSAHATFAPFRVDPPPSSSSMPPSPTALYRHLALVDAATGWLSGLRCQEQPAQTPRDDRGPVQVCQGVIDRTTDGGQTWRRQYLGDVQVGKLQFVDRDHGWAIGLTGYGCADGRCTGALFQTADGGVHWRVAMTTTISLTDLAFTSPAAGWLLGRVCADPRTVADCPWLLLTTVDGGQSWRQTVVPARGTALALAHPTPADGWIVAAADGPADPQLIVTHDGGAHWQPLLHPGQSFRYGQQVFFLSATRGWLLAGGQPGAGQQPKVLYGTSDGGRTWTRLADAIPWNDANGRLGGLPGGGYLGPLIFSTERDGWIASARGSLLHSADGGRSWQAIQLDDYYLVEVGFADARHGWALSLEGPGLWTTADGGVTWTKRALPGP